MKHLGITMIAVFAIGCSSKTRIKECDDFVAVAEKLEKCEQIPAASRTSITCAVDQVRKMLKLLEDVGDQAPKSQLDTLAQTCRTQSDSIRKMYEKAAPDCLK